MQLLVNIYRSAPAKGEKTLTEKEAFDKVCEALEKIKGGSNFTAEKANPKLLTGQTRRLYKLVWIENGDLCDKTANLEHLFTEPSGMGSAFEYIYAVQDEIDTILDLKLGDQLPMQFNRDNPNSKGVIARIL